MYLYEQRCYVQIDNIKSQQWVKSISIQAGRVLAGLLYHVATICKILLDDKPGDGMMCTKGENVC